MVVCRGVRGAISVETNTRDAILEATQSLLQQMIATNEIREEDVASVIFTSTPDLTAAYPAGAARALGWQSVALMGFQEIDCPTGLPRTIRVLMHWNTNKSLTDIQHVYMRGAEKLRPDLYPKNKVILNGSDDV